MLTPETPGAVICVSITTNVRITALAHKVLFSALEPPPFKKQGRFWCMLALPDTML
jgi:hypothetical protein